MFGIFDPYVFLVGLLSKNIIPSLETNSHKIVQWSINENAKEVPSNKKKWLLKLEYASDVLFNHQNV